MTRQYELTAHIRNAGMVKTTISAASEFNARRAAEQIVGKDNIRIFDGHQVRDSNPQSGSRPNS